MPWPGSCCGRISRFSVVGEVLVEVPGEKIVAAEFVCPGPIALALIDRHRAVLSTVPAEVPWPFPSTLRRRAMRGPVTGSFRAPVWGQCAHSR